MKRTINQLGVYGVFGSMVLSGALSGCVGAPVDEPEGPVAEAAAALTDGTTYVFTSTQGSLALGGAKWSPIIGATPQVTTYRADGRNDQFWNVNTIDSTWFQLQNHYTGLCLTSNAKWTYASMQVCDAASSAQWWTLTSGKLKAYNGYYVGTTNGTFAAGEDIQMQIINYAPTWTVSVDSPPANTCPTISTNESFNSFTKSAYSAGTVAGTNVSYEVYDPNSGGSMTLAGDDDAFSAKWGSSGDFLARAGLSFDKTKTAGQIGNIYADFKFWFKDAAIHGNGSTGGGVGVYGWFLSDKGCGTSANPSKLAEYYITEAPLGELNIPTTSSTITKYTDRFWVDGEYYSVFKVNVNVARDTICGKRTFEQYISVRHVPRKCGTVDVRAHFSKWYSLGMGTIPGVSLGYLSEAKMLVESWGATGTDNHFKFIALNVHQ